MDKFYKILKIIFMIVCLLSICSNVFAVDTYTTVNCYGTDYNAKINYFMTPYYYYYVCNYKNASNIVCFDVYFSNYEFYFKSANNGNITTVSSNTNYDNISIATDSTVTPLYRVHCQWRNTVPATAFTNLFNKLNSLTINPSDNNYTYYNDSITGNKIQLSSITNGSFNLNGSSSTQVNISNNTNISNFDIKNAQGTIMFSNNTFISPHIENSWFISDWDFDNLFLNLGSVPYGNNDTIDFYINDSTIGQSLLLRDFATSIGAGSVENPILIPQPSINKLIVFTESFSLRIVYSSCEDTDYPINRYELGTYNISLDSSLVEELNNNTERDIQNDILETNQEINQGITDLNSNITNPTIDSGLDDLPSIDVNDPTMTGLNSIFQGIYTVFTYDGTPRDIVIPVPNTNQNITIHPTFISDYLSSHGGASIVGLIQGYWAYLLCKYVISDIATILEKIQSGNIDKVKTKNIKKEML